MPRMTPKYKLSRRAVKDLSGIWRYTVDTWSRQQADQYVAGLLAAMAEIAKAPASMGRSYEHVRSGYRKYLWGKHVIFYRIQDDGAMLVVRVLHEIMDSDRNL